MSSLAKQKGAAQSGGFVSQLFQAGLYKPTQGRIVRQVTFVAAAILALLAANEIAGWIADFFSRSSARSVYYVSLLAVSLIGVWICYRLVNYTTFADFLIAVEAEMNKVSWPTRHELWRAALVVMFVIFALALVLYVFDLAWTLLFQLIGIRYG